MIEMRPVTFKFGQDNHGQLIMHDGRLMASLVRLDSQMHDEGVRGCWLMDVGFGRFGGIGPVFENLDIAKHRIEQELVRTGAIPAEAI